MTRERIERAAGEYSGSVLGFKDNPVVMNKHKAFMDGAHWRINSVWHDATDIPKKGEYIVMVFRSGNFASWNVSYNIVDVFKKFDVILWSYSKDLLPERKEETK